MATKNKAGAVRGWAKEYYRRSPEIDCRYRAGVYTLTDLATGEQLKVSSRSVYAKVLDKEMERRQDLADASSQ